MPSAESPQLRHVYHISWPRLLPLPLLVLGLFLLFAVDECPAFGAKISWGDYLAVLGAILVFFSPFLLLLWQSRLVLTPEGIAHHQFGYTVRSTWADVEYIMMNRNAGAPALYLAKPGTHSFLLRAATGFVGATMPGASGMFGNTQKLGQGRLILLAPFMIHWNKGALRADIQRWAPHLFDEDGSIKVNL